MSDGTHIEWTDATWNIVNGCSVVSPGCTNCYAMRLAGTRLKHHASRAGLTVDTKAGPVWTGDTRFNEAALRDPLKWRRPRKIFVCAHGDLFHESVPDEWIDRVFAVMALAPRHVFQVLTKRPERMREYVGGGYGTAIGRIWARAQHIGSDGFTKARATLNEGVMPWPLPNVWLGTSVEDQQRADERIPILLATPAAVRWLSMEPLIGPVEWKDEYRTAARALTGSIRTSFAGIDWIVLGGESGPGARPMHPDWARSIRDLCAEDGVPFLFKQWGAWAASTVDRASTHFLNPEGRLTKACDALAAPDDVGIVRMSKKAAGRLLDGVQHDGYPAP